MNVFRSYSVVRVTVTRFLFLVFFSIFFTSEIQLLLQAAYRLRYIQKIQIFLTVYLFIYYEFHSKNCHFQVSSPN